MKNLKDFWPSYLNATQIIDARAEPRIETRIECRSELGNGRTKSRIMPANGA